MFDTNAVVFISNEFDEAQSKKIADVLNTNKIKTTTDISRATIVVKPVPKEQQQNNKLTVATLNIATLSEAIRESAKNEIDKVMAQIYAQAYQIMPKVEICDIELMTERKQKHNRKNFIQNQNIKKFNKIQLKHKQILFNRTRHK